MANDRVAAVERALSILNSFSVDNPAQSLKQLAAATGFYKSTILRLSASLLRNGYLVRDAAGIYRLGPALINLGEISRRNFDIGTTVRPVLEELRDRFNESTAFYIRSGNERICLYRANADRAIHHHLQEGQRLPLEKGAAGRVLLAYAGAKGEPYAGILVRGWYASRGERDPDVGSVAVPLPASGGDIYAVLAISGLISRFDDARCEEFAAALQEQAAELSTRLDSAALGRISTGGAGSSADG